MTTLKITMSLIDKTNPSTSDQFIWDCEISGFALKVAPSGRKTFIMKYVNQGGRQRKQTIGKYGNLTLEEARKKAKIWRGLIADGKDPAAAKDAKKASMTLNEYSKVYFAKAKKKASTMDTDRRNYQNHLQGTLGHLPLPQIDKNDVRSWYSRLEDRPGAANRTLKLLAAMLNEAGRQELRDPTHNPARSIERYPEVARDRFLTHEELIRLGAALDLVEKERIVHPSIIAAVRLALLTGARKSEILTLKWLQVDFDQSIVWLSDSKVGPREIPLSLAAIRLLQSLPRLEENPYVLPGRLAGAHLTNPAKGFRKIMDLAGIKNFRFHDLRHTYASHAAMGGLTQPMIAKLLGHKQTRTAERYMHFDRAPILRANEIVSDSIINGLNDGNLVALPTN